MNQRISSLSLHTRLILLAMLSCAGCAQPHAGKRDDAATNSALLQPTRTIRERTMLLGNSVEGAELTAYRFGNGESPVLIFGGIHGNEPESVALAGRFLELLRTEPLAAAHTPVVIYPIANPDGYAKRSRYNVRGIDLNRNFPAENWLPSKQRGRQPVNQPESRALMKLVKELRPRCVIAIHSIGGRDRECNNYDGPAEALAAAMATHNDYPVKDSIGYPTPGSFGSWCGIDLQIPTITLELPRGIRDDVAWQQNRDALLAAIRFAESLPPSNPPPSGSPLRSPAATR